METIKPDCEKQRVLGSILINRQMETLSRINGKTLSLGELNLTTMFRTTSTTNCQVPGLAMLVRERLLPVTSIQDTFITKKGFLESTSLFIK